MAFARGKYAKAISDRSGMEFPYNEMIREWNRLIELGIDGICTKYPEKLNLLIKEDVV